LLFTFIEHSKLLSKQRSKELLYYQRLINLRRCQWHGSSKCFKG